MKFIFSVVEEQALDLKESILKLFLLQSSLTKSKIWKTYQHACAATGHVTIGHSKFVEL